MVAARFMACLLTAAITCLGGCATVVNMKEGYSFELKPSGGSSPPKQVYGGVIRDVTSIHDALTMESDENVAHSMLFTAAALPMFVIDLPLSALADTLTLPITLSAARQ